MCKYPEGVSSNCGSYYYRGLTLREKKEALDQHNRLRSRVAMGSTNHPSAGNMMELQWDEELATLAQRHADQCSFVHDCSDCRKVSRFRVGQNLLRDKSISNERPDWRFAIESWFREIKDYPNADNSATYRSYIFLSSLRANHIQYQVHPRNRTLCPNDMGRDYSCGLWAHHLYK